MTQDQLAPAIGVPLSEIEQIVIGEHAVTAGTGLRLSGFWGTSDAFWSGLQSPYELAKAKDELADALTDVAPLTGT